jgi:hypothetical protein
MKIEIGIKHKREKREEKYFSYHVQPNMLYLQPMSTSIFFFFILLPQMRSS